MKNHAAPAHAQQLRTTYRAISRQIVMNYERRGAREIFKNSKYRATHVLSLWYEMNERTRGASKTLARCRYTHGASSIRNSISAARANGKRTAYINRCRVAAVAGARLLVPLARILIVSRFFAYHNHKLRI